MTKVLHVEHQIHTRARTGDPCRVPELRDPVIRDAKLSDRDHKTIEGEVESLEARIDEAVFALYGVKGLPGE